MFVPAVNAARVIGCAGFSPSFITYISNNMDSNSVNLLIPGKVGSFILGKHYFDTIAGKNVAKYLFVPLLEKAAQVENHP